MTMAKVRAKVSASKVQSICKRKHKSRIEKAVTAPSLRDKHESTAMCLPEIAIFAAGYRNSKDIVTAR